MKAVPCCLDKASGRSEQTFTTPPIHSTLPDMVKSPVLKKRDATEESTTEGSVPMDWGEGPEEHPPSDSRTAAVPNSVEQVAF